MTSVERKHRSFLFGLGAQRQASNKEFGDGHY